jgi:hypothetical protein
MILLFNMYGLYVEYSFGVLNTYSETLIMAMEISRTVLITILCL